jgi:hypothetical protein
MPSHSELLGILRALALAKKTSWAYPYLSHLLQQWDLGSWCKNDLICNNGLRSHHCNDDLRDVA